MGSNFSCSITHNNFLFTCLSSTSICFFLGQLKWGKYLTRMLQKQLLIQATCCLSKKLIEIKKTHSNQKRSLFCLWKWDFFFNLNNTGDCCLNVKIYSIPFRYSKLVNHGNTQSLYSTLITRRQKCHKFFTSIQRGTQRNFRNA